MCVKLYGILLYEWMNFQWFKFILCLIQPNANTGFVLPFPLFVQSYSQNNKVEVLKNPAAVAGSVMDSMILDLISNLTFFQCEEGAVMSLGHCADFLDGSRGMEKGWAALVSPWCFWRMLLLLMGAGSAPWEHPALPGRENDLFTPVLWIPAYLGLPESPRAAHSSRLELGSLGSGPVPIYAAGRFYFSARQLSRTFLYKKLQKRSELLSLSSSISSA